MLTQPHPTPVMQTDASVSTFCPKLATLKARAKALKKRRKEEQRRFFTAVCNSLHALGFSF